MTTGKPTGSYLITANDGQGQQTEHLVGRGDTQLPSPTKWRPNGSAYVRGTGSVDLTPAEDNDAGSAVFATPVSTDGLDATFTALIDSGTGADGMTFALLDATQTDPNALGYNGGGLGFGGLPGVAIALDTYQNATDPSSNFMGVSTGGVSGDPSSLVWTETSTTVPALRSSPHVVHITMNGGEIVVAIDGLQVLDTTVAVPASAYVAFTGSTGGLDDIHRVSAVTIAAG